MAVKTYSLQNLPVDQWRELIGDSLLSSPEFLSLWCTPGGRGEVVCDERNGQFVSGMAGVIFGNGFLGRFESMPRSLPGGLFFAGNLDEQQRRDSARRIIAAISGKGHLRMVINSTDRIFGELGFSKKIMSTHTIELKGFTPGKKVQEHMRAADRRGGEVKEVVPEDNDALYGLAVESNKRHGRKLPYSREFFRNMIELSQQDSRLLILKVVCEDRPVAFRISVIESDHLINWQLYIDDRYSNIKPGVLLMKRVLETAEKKKLQNLNMGSSPEEAESLKRYKESWGGKEITIPYYVKHSMIGRILYGLRGK